MLWANRNGYFYVLDRVTGKFLLGQPFVKVNWSSGLDATGRPMQTPQPDGLPTYPGNQGGTNWYPPSFSPRTGLFYFAAWENYGTVYRKEEVEYQPGRNFVGGGFTVVTPAAGAPTIGIGRRGPINNWTDEVGHGAVMAMDPQTGEVKWKYDQFDVTDSGMLTTASDLLFTGGREGHFHALDAKTGALLWQRQPRRPDRDGADHLPGRGQAVRVGDRRQHAGDVRVTRHQALIPAGGRAVQRR